jgi:hypothetical protein
VALVLGVPFILLAAYVVVFGLTPSQRAASEGIVSWLKSFGRLGAFFAGPAGELAVKLTRWITHKIAEAFGDLEHLATTWFSAIFQYYDKVITNALEWPLWVWRLQRWLLDVEIPKLVRLATHAPSAITTTITKRLQPITRTIVRLPKLTKAQATALVSAAVATYIHPYLAQLRWLRAHFHALTAVLPRVIPIPHVPTFPNIWRRLRALERKLAPAAVTALVVAALARMGLSWIRCNKTKRVGKAICGLDESLVDKFLLDALAIFGVLSIVEFAEGLVAIEDEAVGIMGRLVREWPT